MTPEIVDACLSLADKEATHGIRFMFHFAASVEAATKERCAKIVDKWQHEGSYESCCDSAVHVALLDVAKRIRDVADVIKGV